jgi:site-specific recombinase XerD
MLAGNTQSGAGVWMGSGVQAKMSALVQVMRHAGLAMIDACCLERSQICHHKGQFRVRLQSRQETSKKAHLQPVNNAVPVSVGKALMAVLNGNPRYVFWNYTGSGPASDEQKRAVSEKFFQRYMRTLLDKAGLPNATGHKLRHTLAIEMIRHGASYEDVAAALGNTVAVVANFYRTNGPRSAKARRTRRYKPLGDYATSSCAAKT